MNETPTQHGESEAAEYREAVAAEVRALMGRHRVSGVRLARLLGMSQSKLARRLIGEVPFDIDELFRIARLFNISIATLIAPSTFKGAQRSLAAA